ncbi:unnamed protein product [Ectocarpus sp. CCAP 1310/34]|nr:unnamed protein product [Ectocarpus sp. CCAP 1310/34]
MLSGQGKTAEQCNTAAKYPMSVEKVRTEKLPAPLEGCREPKCYRCRRRPALLPPIGRTQDWGHVAKCHLHSSMVLSKLNRHDEALRCLGQVLAMVQEGKLDVGGNSPQKLCLVAICYHNMAVEQLILRHAGEACMSSQNARRLARLCLSYSNRWLHSFEGTHKLALAELSRSLSTTGGDGAGGNVGQRRGSGGCGEGEREQKDILQRLTEELFS